MKHKYEEHPTYYWPYMALHIMKTCKDCGYRRCDECGIGDPERDCTVIEGEVVRDVPMLEVQSQNNVTKNQ